MTTSSSGMSSDSLSSPPSSQGDEVGLYCPGKTLVLKRHIPPPPCGPYYDHSAPPRPLLPKRVPKLQWCLTHPPRPGATDLQDTRTITFKASIRTGHQCGAQVWLTDDGLVAKVYDPLYYCIFDREWKSDTINVTAEADQDYSNEAAAYSALQNTSVQGRSMPQYYGSWTAEVSIEVEGQEHVRQVRMILVEHIVGIQMMKLNPFKLTRKARDSIMCKVIEAKTDILLAGLEHHDFEPRNIMIASSEFAVAGAESRFEDPDLRVCIIDFAISAVYELAGEERLGAEYNNPLFFWAGADIYCGYGWLPPRAEATDWMWEVWGCGGKDGKYIKVERDLNDCHSRPVWPGM